MGVRRATEADLPQILDYAVQFHAYSPWRSVPMDMAAVETLARGLLTGGAIFVSESGMCGGILAPLYFAPSRLVATELFWWAPQDGQALREAFEGWAREQGAFAAQFSALADDRLPAVARIYRRSGFRPAETAFIKGL